MKPVPWVCVASTVVILVAALIIGLALGLQSRPDADESPVTTRDGLPVNVHLIYIPWKRACKESNAKKCILADKLGFDMTYALNLQKKLNHAKVILWTYDKLHSTSEEISPGLWDALWNRVKHPTMIVDFYRWFVLFHFGGVYMQYDSVWKKTDARHFLSKTGDTRLFTEYVLSPEECKKYGNRRIRNFEPEESIRVANQTISTHIKHDPFVKYVMEQIYDKIMNLDVNEDYDILYISGNACVSAAYDKYPAKHKLDLVPLQGTKKLVNWSSRRSWRTDGK
jgi:hypothetical protein